MSRWWNQVAGAAIDRVGFWPLLLALLGTAILAALAWQTYPKWLPRRAWWDAVRRALSWLRHLRLPRWRWRRRKSRGNTTRPDPVAAEADDSLPDRPAADFASLADEYASAGRYAEAVRERLRGMVRELVDAGVITHHPEWTVTELARAAATTAPPTASPLHGATTTFSDIWYGQRPATADHDTRMRGYAADVHTCLTPVGVGR